MLLHRLRLRLLVPRRLRPLATTALFTALRALFAGNAVECPCCSGRFRRFLPYPTLYCPRCGAYERHRQLCLLIDSRPALVESRDVLHVGPERCIADRYRTRARSWLAIDLDHPLADRRMDVQQLDLADASFDLALCSHVLDAVPDPVRALRELHRVLRPGGLLLLHTPPGRDAVADARAAGFTVEQLVLDEQQSPQLRGRLGLDTAPVLLCTR